MLPSDSTLTTQTADMSFVATLDLALEGPRQTFLNNRMLQHIRAGTMTLDLYKSLLRETYHFVKHTPTHLRLAASRLQDQALCARFLKHAQEETGHDLWALNDLKALGEDIEAVKKSNPLPHTMALIAYQHYTVTRLNPKALLGLEYAMEGLTAQAGGDAIRQIAINLQLPKAALTFFMGHALLDAQHVEDDVDIINAFITSPEDQADVIRNAKDSVILYSALYDGLCENLGL